MPYKPLGNTVLVEIDPEVTEIHGIEIPDAYRETPQWCTVLASGPGGKFKNGERHPMDVKPGDRVLVTPWALKTAYTSTPVPDEARQRVVQYSEVMAVMEQESAPQG